MTRDNCEAMTYGEPGRDCQRDVEGEFDLVFANKTFSKRLCGPCRAMYERMEHVEVQPVGGVEQ